MLPKFENKWSWKPYFQAPSLLFLYKKIRDFHMPNDLIILNENPYLNATY